MTNIITKKSNTMLTFLLGPSVKDEMMKSDVWYQLMKYSFVKTGVNSVCVGMVNLTAPSKGHSGIFQKTAKVKKILDAYKVLLRFTVG